MAWQIIGVLREMDFKRSTSGLCVCESHIGFNHNTNIRIGAPEIGAYLMEYMTHKRVDGLKYEPGDILMDKLDYHLYHILYICKEEHSFGVDLWYICSDLSSEKKRILKGLPSVLEENEVYMRLGNNKDPFDKIQAKRDKIRSIDRSIREAKAKSAL